MAIESWTRGFPELAALDPALVRELEARSQVLRVATDELVLGAGGVGTLFPFVLEGSLRVTLMSEEGREVLLYRLEPGGTCTLSAACLLSGDRVGATVQAEAPARLAVLPARDFHRLLDASKPFRDLVFTTFAQRLSELVTRLDAMLFRTVESRLAELLLARAEAGAVAATHGELALELGTAREVVSRRLEGLASRGLVALARGNVRLLDAPALEKLAESPAV